MISKIYCLNFFYSYTIKNKLQKCDELCKNHNRCVEMPKEDNKILKCNHGEKSI